MQTPSSIRRLIRDIEAVTNIIPEWLLLLLGSGAIPSLWTSTDPITIPCSAQALPRAIGQIPLGSRVATAQAEWQRTLIRALFGPEAIASLYHVAAITVGSRIVACLGWHQDWLTQSNEALTVNIPSLTRLLRDALVLELARTDRHGLRWVVQRSDRLVVAARPNGQILGATPAASDILKALKFVRCHRSRSDAPELPRILVEAIGRGSSRQAKLDDHTTALFKPVNGRGDSWLPVIGIELLVEVKTNARVFEPPLSRLTPVERDILERILTGASNKEIAAGRGTRFATVKNQVSEVLRKLGASSRRDLFVPALFASTMAVSDPSMTVTR